MAGAGAEAHSAIVPTAVDPDSTTFLATKDGPLRNGTHVIVGSPQYHPAHERAEQPLHPASHRDPRAPLLSVSPGGASASHPEHNLMLPGAGPHTRMNEGGQGARGKQENVPHYYINAPGPTAMARCTLARFGPGVAVAAGPRWPV